MYVYAAKPKCNMDTKGIIRTSELVIGLLPYRDEFILANQIRYTAQDNMHGKEFKELGYDFDSWENQGVKTSADWITGQLVNGNIIKHTRSILNEQTGKNDEYYVLTKAGRKMKGENGLKTFEKLKGWTEEKKNNKRKKKLQEAALLQYQTELHPLIKSVNESTIEANKISKTTNTYIATFTSIAGLYYIVQLAMTLIPSGYEYRQCAINLIFFFSFFGTLLVLVLRKGRKA